MLSNRAYRDHSFLIVHETPESVALAHYLNSIGAHVVLYTSVKPSKTMIYEAEDLRLTYQALEELGGEDYEQFDKAVETAKSKILREEYELRAKLTDPFDGYDTPESEFSDISMSSDEEGGNEAENREERARRREEEYHRARRKRHIKRTKKFKHRREIAMHGLKQTWLSRNVGGASLINEASAVMRGTHEAVPSRIVLGRVSEFLTERQRREYQERIFKASALTLSLASTMRFFRNSTFHRIDSNAKVKGKLELVELPWKCSTTSRSLWAGFPIKVVNSMDQLKLATEDQKISCVYLAVPYSSAILLREHRKLLAEIHMTFRGRVNYVSLQPSLQIWKYFPSAICHADKRHALYPVLGLFLPRRDIQRANIAKTDAPPPDSHIILTLNYQAKHLKILAEKEAKKKAKQKKKKRKSKKQGFNLFGLNADKDEVEHEPESKAADKQQAQPKRNGVEPNANKEKQLAGSNGATRTEQLVATKPKKEKKDKRKHIPDPDEEDGRRVWFSYTAPCKGELDNRERFLTLKAYRREKFNKANFVTANARDIIRWQIVTAYNDFLHRNPQSENNRFFGGMGRNNLARMAASNEKKKKRHVSSSRGHYHRSHYAWFHPRFDGGSLVRYTAPALTTYKAGVVHYRHRSKASNWDLCFVLLVPTVIALKLNHCRPLRMYTRGSKEVLNVAGSAVCELLNVCGYQTISSLVWFFLDGGAFAIVLVQWCLFYYYGDLLVDYIAQRFCPPEVGSEDLCFYLDDFIKRGKAEGKPCNAIRALQSREAGLQSDLPPHHVPLYERYMRTPM